MKPTPSVRHRTFHDEINRAMYRLTGHWLVNAYRRGELFAMDYYARAMATFSPAGPP